MYSNFAFAILLASVSSLGVLFSLCALHIGTYLPQCLLGQFWSYFSLHMMVACSLWSEAMLPSWFLVDHVFRHLVVFVWGVAVFV